MRLIDTFRTVLSLAYSPCGRYLYSAGWQHVSRWDVTTGDERPFKQEGCAGYCQSLSVSADGKRLAWFAQPQAEARWELRTGKVAAFRQSGSHRLGRASLTDESTGCVHLPGGKILHTAGSVAVSPDGSLIALWDGKGVQVGRPKPKPLTLGTLVRLQDVTLLDPFELAPSPIAFGFASSQLVWGVGQQRIDLWDVKERRFVGGVDVEHVPRAVTPDGRTGITTRCREVNYTSRYEVLLIDLITGLVRERYDWDVGMTGPIAVAPDGLTVAVAGMSGGIAIFDLDN